MKNILITGSDGQVGRELQELASNLYLKDFKLIFTNRLQLDISNMDEVIEFFRKENIS